MTDDETREPATVWDAFEYKKAEPMRLQVTNASDDWYLTIDQSGHVELNPRFTVDQAARGFWDAVENMRPKDSLAELIQLLESHPTAQAGALLESWRQRKTQPPTTNAG